MDTKKQTMVQKSGPRDVFYYLLSIVTLYMSAISFTVLLFQLINQWFPDALAFSYGADNAIRWSAALLIVSFPVYLWIVWLINKDISADPDKREIKVRKWLGYLTLFISAVVSLIDVAFLVYYLLGGEITIRFVLKVLVVLVVTGTIFFYYLHELRNKQTSMKLLAIIASVIVLAGLVAAFITVGGPGKQRLVRFDERKVSDLSGIESAIGTYWQNKSTLPNTLSDIPNYQIPVDPQYDAPYEYRVTGSMSYQLCANFNLPSTPENRGVYPAIYPYQSWDHGVGRVCFERTIDPNMYSKPIPR